MTTNAGIGYGTVLEIALASAPTAFTYVREVFSATPPSDTDESVDATHMASPNRTREYIPGMTDGGEASFEMNYVPGSATDIFLRSTIKGVKLVARLTFANGVRILFNCTRQGYEKSVPNEDKMTATLTLKVSGEPSQSAAAAPINLVAPSISGTEKVGQVLTADPGEWAGALSLTYQWQADTAGNGTFANISGATSQTYVLAAGQEGDDVIVVVTAANSSIYTTAAESDETGAIAAA
jgi:hypothetical protein